MGCGALVYRRGSSKTSVEGGPDSAGSANSEDGDATEDARRTEVADEEEDDCVASLSPSPSVHTVQSSITSIPSLQTGFSSTGGSVRYYLNKGSSFSEQDLRSDVPTIAETIADMQDFQDLPPARSSSLGVSSARSSVSSSGGAHHTSSDEHHLTFSPRGSLVERQVFIDGRMHPLAVMCAADRPESCSPAVGDLGGCSEVPSIRDDMSVTSAPSEICVSFPPSIYCSENGSATPTRQRMQQLSGLRHRGSNERNSTSSSKSITSGSSSLIKQIKENPLLTLVAQGQQEVSEPYEVFENIARQTSGGDDSTLPPPTRTKSTPPCFAPTVGKR